MIGQLRDAAAGPGDAVGSTDANGTVRLAGVFRKSRSNSVPILGTAAFQTVYSCKSAALGRCSETQLHDRRNPSDEASVLDACVSATSPSPLFGYVHAVGEPERVLVAGRLAETQNHADIDAEPDKHDWVRAIVVVPGVGGGVAVRLAELDLPVVSYNGGEAPIDTERFVNGGAEAAARRCESGSSYCSSALTAPLSRPS